MPYRILGIATPIYTEEEMTVPRLSKDGQHVEGWVRKPEGPWQPGDLLWLPPTATKSTDLDRAGSIVDVLEGPGDYDWLTAQLNKRERYLDAIRAKVRAGAYRLTAQLARFLGMPFDEDAVELMPRQGTGTVAYRSADLATAKQVRDEAMRLIGPPTAHKSWCVTGHPTDLRCEVMIGG